MLTLHTQFIVVFQIINLYMYHKLYNCSLNMYFIKDLIDLLFILTGFYSNFRIFTAGFSRILIVWTRVLTRTGLCIWIEADNSLTWHLRLAIIWVGLAILKWFMPDMQAVFLNHAVKFTSQSKKKILCLTIHKNHEWMIQAKHFHYNFWNKSSYIKFTLFPG